MGKLLGLVILTSLVAVPRAEAMTGNRCRDAFVVVSAAMVSDETVVSTRFEDYRVERMKVLETKVSEADRDRLYTALVKDESGMFGTLLKVFKHDPIKFSLQNPKPSSEFNLSGLKEQSKELIEKIKRSSGAEKIQAEKALLQHEVWASRQLLSVLMQRDSSANALTLTTRAGVKVERYYAGNGMFKYNQQYKALFEWIAGDAFRMETAELLIGSAFHELTTSLSEFTPIQVEAARSLRGQALPSKLNPINLINKRPGIEAKLAAAEEKIEADFKADPFRHASAEVGAGTSAGAETVPQIKTLVDEVHRHDRNLVYSAVFADMGVGKDLAKALRDPRNANVRNFLTRVRDAHQRLNAALPVMRAEYLKQLEQAKWEAGSEIYRLVSTFMIPDPKNPYRFELKGFTPSDASKVESAANWIAKDPKRVALMKKLYGESALLNFDSKDFKGQVLELRQSVETTYLVSLQSSWDLEFKNRPFRTDLDLAQLTALTANKLKLDERKKIVELLVIGQHGLGGELTQYLESQPFEELSLKYFISNIDSTDTEYAYKRADTILALWKNAFFRTNADAGAVADAKDSGLVPVGANRFEFVPRENKKVDMPAFTTQSRTAVEAEIRWLLEDPNRYEFAKLTVANLLIQFHTEERNKKYGVSLIEAFAGVGRGEKNRTLRLGPAARRLFAKVQAVTFTNSVSTGKDVTPIDIEDSLIEMEKDIRQNKEASKNKPVAVPLERSRRRGFQDLDVELQSKSETFLDYARTRMGLLKDSFTPEVKRNIFDFIIGHPSGFLGEYGVALAKMGRVSTADGSFDLGQETRALIQLSGQPGRARALMAKQLLVGEQILTLMSDSALAGQPDFTTVINVQDVGYRNRMTSLNVHLPKEFLNDKEIYAFRMNIHHILRKPEYVEYAQLLLAEAAIHFGKLPNAEAFAKPGLFGRLTFAGRSAAAVRELKSKIESEFLLEISTPQVKFAKPATAERKVVNLPSLPPLQYTEETPQLKIDVAPLMQHLGDDFSLSIAGHSSAHMERWSNSQLDILDIVLERYKTLETRLFDMRDLSASHFDSLVKPVGSRAEGTARIVTADTMGGLRDHAKGIIDLKADASAMRAFVTEVIEKLAPMEKTLAREALKDPTFAPVSARFADSVAASARFLAQTDARLKSVSDSISVGFREVKEAVASSSDHVAADNLASAERIRAAAAALRKAR